MFLSQKLLEYTNLLELVLHNTNFEPNVLFLFVSTGCEYEKNLPMVWARQIPKPYTNFNFWSMFDDKKPFLDSQIML